MPLATTRDVPAALASNGTLDAGSFNRVDATSGAVTVALPSSPAPGASLSVMKVDTTRNAVSVTGASGGTVDLARQGVTAEFVAATGGTWYVVQHSTPPGMLEAIVSHDGSAGGGVRPIGFYRVRWVGGTARPTNMAAGDIWERDA